MFISHNLVGKDVLSTSIARMTWLAFGERKALVEAEVVTSVSLVLSLGKSDFAPLLFPGGARVLREEGPGVHQGEPDLPPLESGQQEVRAHFSKPRRRSSL